MNQNMLMGMMMIITILINPSPFPNWMLSVWSPINSISIYYYYHNHHLSEMAKVEMKWIGFVMYFQVSYCDFDNDNSHNNNNNYISRWDCIFLSLSLSRVINRAHWTLQMIRVSGVIMGIVELVVVWNLHPIDLPSGSVQFRRCLTLTPVLVVVFLQWGN